MIPILISLRLLMIITLFKNILKSFPFEIWERKSFPLFIAWRIKQVVFPFGIITRSCFFTFLSFSFSLQTYFGMDVSAVEDPVQRRALETMIKTYGQTPRQLFQSAHASRPGSKLNIEGELPAAVGLLVQFAFRETREQVKEITYPVCHLDFNRIQENTAQLLRGQAFSQTLEAGNWVPWSQPEGVHQAVNTDARTASPVRRRCCISDMKRVLWELRSDCGLPEGYYWGKPHQAVT